MTKKHVQLKNIDLPLSTGGPIETNFSGIMIPPRVQIAAHLISILKIGINTAQFPDFSILNTNEVQILLSIKVRIGIRDNIFSIR